MDTLELLSVVLLEFVILVLLLFFIRYSNRRLLRYIVQLEEQVKQMNQFLDKLSSHNHKLREELAAIRAATDHAEEKTEKESQKVAESAAPERESAATHANAVPVHSHPIHRVRK